MARSRLAVALLVPEPQRTEIDGIRRALGAPGLDRIAPHVTLVPPVNVNDERLPEAVAVLTEAAAATPPVRLHVGPPSTFWPDNPTMYLSVAGDVDEVVRLRTRLAVPPIERIDPRPFVPHVTLAERIEPDWIPVALELLGRYEADMTVTAVHLLRHGDDRRWTTIASAACGGPRIVARGGLDVTLTTADVLDPEAAAFFTRTWRAHLDTSYGPLPRVEPFAIAARREGAVVGVATGWRDDELILDRLVVDPAVRGQGVGAHLLREVAERAVGTDRAVLVCQAGGDAQAWYESHGWTVAIVLPRWRHERHFVRMVWRSPA